MAHASTSRRTAAVKCGAALYVDGCVRSSTPSGVADSSDASALVIPSSWASRRSTRFRRPSAASGRRTGLYWLGPLSIATSVADCATVKLGAVVPK